MNDLEGLLGNPMLNMGIGILGANRGPNAFGNAMQGGLLSAQNAQQMQAVMAMRQMQAQKLRREQMQQAQLEQYIGQLPPAEQTLARLAPEQYVGGVIKASMPQEQPSEARMAQLAYPDLPLPQAIQKYRESGRASTSVNVQNVLPPTIKEGYQYTQGAGGQWRADPVPGGPHDPYAPKPPTEGQRKTSGFLQRMESVAPEIAATEEAPGMIDYFASGSAVTNPAVSERYQKYLKSSREWVAGALRYESGAAVPETEFWRYYQTYFAVPGDKPGTIQAKAAARKRMEESLRTSAGPVMAPPLVAPGASAEDARRRLKESGYVD